MEEYGSPRKALERIGIDVEVVDYVEIDKYAVKSYNAMYNENFEPQDITTWDKQLDVDLIFHGSPCQDFSLAGKQAGGDKDSGTRSSLLYETVRIVSNLKPKYVIWENVKNVISQKHRHNFDKYLDEMSKLGYINYYQVLNAKDYGIPQNRERVFTISILKDSPLVIGSMQEHASRRNDGICPTLTSAMGMGGGQIPIIIENIPFTFPQKQELKLKLKDMLEDNVDEKYYLSDKMINYLMSNNTKDYNRKEVFMRNFDENKEVAATILTTAGNRAVDNFVFKKDTKNYIEWKEKGKLDSDCRAFKENKISGAITATPKGKVLLIKNATKKEYVEAYEGDSINIAYPTSTTRRGRVGNQVSQTITTSDNMGVVENLRIRKLTPLECWRLMGFDDIDFEKASKVNSNAQLYKQARK